MKDERGQVSENRVKKYMQEAGLTESNSGSAEGAGAAAIEGGEGGDQKKKSASKKQKDKARDKAAFDEW